MQPAADLGVIEISLVFEQGRMQLDKQVEQIDPLVCPGRPLEIAALDELRHPFDLSGEFFLFRKFGIVCFKIMFMFIVTVKIA